MRYQYVENAEEYLNYDWPVVKATDYLEIIRSGARSSEAYAAPRAAVIALVMGELVEGEGRFLDQIVNGSWYYPTKINLITYCKVSEAGPGNLLLA
jgi:hypothetical protein